MFMTGILHPEHTSRFFILHNSNQTRKWMYEHVNFLHVNRLRMFESVWYVWELDPVQNTYKTSITHNT